MTPSQPITQFKELVHKTFNTCGLDVRRYRPSEQTPSHYEQRRRRLMDEHGITVVLDVGAGTGCYGGALREGGFRGRIASFEPLPGSCERLRRRAAGDESWLIYNLALSDHVGEVVFHEAGNGASSSCLPMAERHLEAAPYTAYTGEQTVRCATLDSLLDEIVRPDDRVMLKLDVQGYEREVLRGAGETLELVDMIDTELSLCELYEGQALLPEMVTCLHEARFLTVAFADEFIDLETDRTLQVNGLFERPLARSCLTEAPATAPEAEHRSPVKLAPEPARGVI